MQQLPAIGLLCSLSRGSQGLGPWGLGLLSRISGGSKANWYPGLGLGFRNMVQGLRLGFG